MLIPIIPLASAVLAAFGFQLLCWYWRLSPADREKADALAGEYALSIFRKGLAQLSNQETNDVYSLVRKRHFDGGQ